MGPVKSVRGRQYIDSHHFLLSITSRQDENLSYKYIFLKFLVYRRKVRKRDF